MKEKDEFLRRFNEAFAKNDTDFILKSISDDIVWDMVGQSKMEGKEAVKEALKEMQDIETLKMDISQIITDGRSAAVNGSMKIKQASGEINAFGFSDFYEIDGSKDMKISKMISYVVPLKEE